MDFSAVNAAALAAYPSLLQRWLPGGRLHGREYKCGDLQGAKGDSLSVNIQSGKWADFSTGDKGGDPVSLYAAIRKLSQIDAAKELAEHLAVRHADDQPAPRQRDDGPQIIIPIPKGTPVGSLRHKTLGEPVARWIYRDANGGGIGIICRFDKPDGGKEILPRVFTDKGWQWKSFPKPRPLYGLDKLAAHPDATVLVVEGEKCADAYNQLNTLGLLAVTWPGGSQAVKHADWSPLAGRTVILWPDADEAGLRAVGEIADTLHAQGCTIRIVDVSGQPDGWDIADAIAAGIAPFEWADGRINDYAGGATLTPPAPEPDGKVVTLKPQTQEKPKPKRKEPATVHDTAGRVYAEGEDWKRFLVWKDIEIYQPKSVHNAKVFLTHHQKMAGVLAMNSFSRNVMLLECPPWDKADGFKPRAITDTDDVNAKAWLETQKVTVSISETHSAIVAAAAQNPFNPVHDYLKGLRWDGRPRIDHWLTYYLGVDPSDYAKAVGRRFLIGAVARAMQPGCKMDTMLILEGGQGIKKSTAVATLFGHEWFTDEIEGVGSKDTSMQMLGRWVVEIAELDALDRSEVKTIKAWIARTTDKFRPPYGRNVIEQPRSCVFIGTINPEGGYLKDATGARRFWPAKCRGIDIDALRADRDQLWAEAVRLYDAGESWWLTEEEANLAREQQADRYEGDPWGEDIDEFVEWRTKVTMAQIMDECLKIPKERRNRSAEIRIGKHLTTEGWTRRREREGGRLKWVYVKTDQLFAPRAVGE